MGLAALNISDSGVGIVAVWAGRVSSVLVVVDLGEVFSSVACRLDRVEVWSAPWEGLFAGCWRVVKVMSQAGPLAGQRQDEQIRRL